MYIDSYDLYVGATASAVVATENTLAKRAGPDTVADAEIHAVDQHSHQAMGERHPSDLAEKIGQIVSQGGPCKYHY